MAITTTEFNAPAIAREGLIPSVYAGIVLVGASDTPLLHKLEVERVTNISHSWLTDTLKAPKNTPACELHQLRGGGASSIQKNSNAVQDTINEYEVTEDMQKVALYDSQTVLERERGKAAKEHALDLEYAFFGLGHDLDAKKSVFTEPHVRTNSKDPAIAAGFFHFLAKGKNAFSNGRRGNVLAFDDNGDWSGGEGAFSWESFMQILQVIYDSGAVPKDVFCGANLKQKINSLRAKAGNTSVITDKTYTNPINTIDTDFGVVNVHLHRFLSSKYGLGDVLLAGDFEYAKNGVLIDTIHKEFQTGRTSSGYYFKTANCLCVKNADAFAIGVGLV